MTFKFKNQIKLDNWTHLKCFEDKLLKQIKIKPYSFYCRAGNTLGFL